MLANTANYEITWEKLPDDFVLDNDPVDNINQPSLAAALTESLELAGKLPAIALATTNYGICTTVNQKMVVKAPERKQGKSNRLLAAVVGSKGRTVVVGSRMS